MGKIIAVFGIFYLVFHTLSSNYQKDMNGADRLTTINELHI